MNNLLAYLLELNISFVILFVAYKIFFEKDRNFFVRRIYLLGVIILPCIAPLFPETATILLNRISPISFNLEEITVFGSVPAQEVSGKISLVNVLIIIYLLILSVGVLKLLIQLAVIIRTIIKSDRYESNGTILLSSKALHASSFFRYIFMDPAFLRNNSFYHILEHENIHKREWHSIDRILAELFVLINWFNPLAWMFRKSVIENLEYMADSAVISKGTDPVKYQLSILNQYIGSASISNQFSSQIKNRINMLNKNYKLGSRWKLALIFPLFCLALFIVSCTEKGDIVEVDSIEHENDKLSSYNFQDPQSARDKVFYIVEEMPKFNGGDPAAEFRKYIAQNLRYPAEAAQKGVTGKIFIQFIVSSNGKVVIPSAQDIASITQKNLDEVVVVAYRTLKEGDPEPEEKYIDLLRNEVIRVISESPDWTPGKQKGKAVNVMFTFPVNFILQ